MFRNRLAAIVVIPSALTLAGCVESSEPPARPEAAAADSRARVLRTRVDVARGLRWELTWGAVSAFDVATGERIREVRLEGANLSGAPETCVPDMVVSRSGALVVSSNAQPSLWRISPARFEVERFDIALDADADKDFGFTALAFTPGESALYAASAVTGSLWRIDLAAAAGRKVDGVASQRGACTLAPAELPERDATRP